MMTISRAVSARAARVRLMNVAIAVTLASVGAWAGAGDQDRAPTLTKPPVPDNSSVTPAARTAYEDFWKQLAKPKADALEKELTALEARARQGESVERDLEKLRGTYPQLFEMAATLESARWIVSGGGGTQRAHCTGLGWIGRNGRLRCIGRLRT